MELSNSDLKLLSYLYHSSREPITKIARATNLTRTQVEYKITNFEKQGIIKKYLLMINYGALDYEHYIFLLIKLKNSEDKKVINYLNSQGNCISVGECYGKYDLYANMLFKDQAEIEIKLSELTQNNLEIIDYLIISPYLTEFHPLKPLSKEKRIFPLTPQKTINKIKLSNEDLEILKLLEKNGRMKVSEIATKIDISDELALYKLRKLYSNKVILGMRLHLDMKKIGYNYSGFFMNIHNLSEKDKIELTKFCRNHKSINAIVLSLNKPNCFIQVFHRTEEELKDTIKEIKLFLGSKATDFEILLMNEENKVSTLPFLK